ncbi:MAG: arginine--tRNA ligase [Gammaproteobacteria bacterium]
MKQTIASLVTEAIDSLCRSGELPEDLAGSKVQIDRTRDPRHGDFACNIAMSMAKQARRNPREIAQALIDAIRPSEMIAAIEIAGPGFINFRLTPSALFGEIATILERGDRYGESQIGDGRSVNVEFISANPTGPLHVGHGRHAAYGASVANLLAATGHKVHREYYVNDAGRQMDILAVSVWIRYLEVCGESIPFPSNGYRGDYVRKIAEQLRVSAGDSYQRPSADVVASLPADAPEGDKEAHIDALIERMRMLLGDSEHRLILLAGLEDILKDIRQDLSEFGVAIDEWFSESSLTESGRVADTIERLRQEGSVYEQDGAQWFKATQFGDEKDRVIVRENGLTTYIASDIAYHLDKRTRGYDLLLDVLGADHHGYVARVRAGLEATGEPPTSLEVRLVQFAVLFRGGEKVQMSTRSGEFVTLRQLREEVGNDAARLFYVLRSNDQHLDFDLELAKSRSNENPVYYIQYAHARICSVFRQLADKKIEWQVDDGLGNLDRLAEPNEISLMTSLSRFPEVVELAANNRAPQNLVHYLRELANEFHTYYNAHTFIVDDAALRDARLTLITAVRHVLRNALKMVGVSSPDVM